MPTTRSAKLTQVITSSVPSIARTMRSIRGVGATIVVAIIRPMSTTVTNMGLPKARHNSSPHSPHTRTTRRRNVPKSQLATAARRTNATTTAAARR